MRTSEQFNEVAKALVAFQKEVESPKKTAENPAYKRGSKAMKYADLDSIIKTITPVLAAHGLSQHQFTSANIEAKTITVTTLLLHESGQFIESDPLELPGENRNMFNAQTVGSAITYGRRYSLSALLGIASEDDDDGNEASIHNENKSQNSPQRTNQNQGRSNPPRNVVPAESTNEVNQKLGEVAKRIEQNGGDLEIIKKQFLQAKGLKNFSVYKKDELLAFMEEMAQEIEQHNAEQGELLKTGTTTAPDQVNWGNKS